MKNLVIVFVAVAVLISCKKTGNADTPVTPPVTAVESYFSDTSTEKLGVDTTPKERLLTIPFVKDADTSILPYNARVMTPPDYSINVPPPGNQRPFNSCVAWTTGYGMLSYQYSIIEGTNDYKSPDNIFAPLYIYNQVKSGNDDGISNIAVALQLLKDQGCSKLRWMPNTQSVMELPNAQAVANAANYTIESYEIFPRVDIDLMKTFISKGYAIPFAFKVDEGFMKGLATSYNIMPDSRLVYTKKSGKFLGNHAMLICGYDDNISAFKTLNSWGDKKGNNGYFWISYDAFKQIILTSFFVPEMYLVIARSVITKKPTDISQTSVVSGGNIIVSESGAVTERGICYNTTGNPTISDAHLPAGSGVGKFIVNITGLTQATTYYIKAYAKTVVGVKYGNQVQINTLDQLNVNTQVWMGKNLDVTTYRNGDPIPEVEDSIAWTTLTTGAWCYYKKDPAFGAVYGKLYNRYALVDPRGLAPAGWHIPNDGEWQTFIDYLGGASVAGGKMKEVGTSHWLSPNTGADNTSGFSGLPGGGRSSNGSFSEIGQRGYWWSRTMNSNGTGTGLWMQYTNPYLQATETDFGQGFSVRCVKD
jgi:uncharacterized protein (TIGR02145 family)